ncbi:MAG: gfo/Idh/MocA family oxidoreductase, partial [Proteobacteria bacterium]|nr:gfo/Idh/MocA family oxidoreductase [Candidatus Fonsibacter sp. PEL5]
MIKISVVGLGQMGKNHLNNLLNIKNINLTNIYDKIKKKELEKKYNTK